MLNFRAMEVTATCDICGRTHTMRSTSKRVRSIRQRLRKLGWRATYIGSDWGTHDHCKECCESNEITVRL